MRTLDALQGPNNRNQSLRLLMLLIILGTFPCYAFAIFIIGSAPLDLPAAQATETATEAATFTPLGADLNLPTATTAPPVLPTHTPLSQPRPATPVQFVPPTPIPVPTNTAQVSISPSPTLLPSATPSIADADGDTVADAADDCPTEFGYADNAGCPYPDDPDRDGWRGDADFCPNEYAPDNPRGCRDFDDDGLDSAQDDCPQVAGPASNRGCPLENSAGG